MCSMPLVLLAVALRRPTLSGYAVLGWRLGEYELQNYAYTTRDSSVTRSRKEVAVPQAYHICTPGVPQA
jgi:hypothetical protein